MSEKAKQILETIGKAIPGMSDQEVDKLLTFSEGMAFMVDRRNSADGRAESQIGRRETA